MTKRGHGPLDRLDAALAVDVPPGRRFVLAVLVRHADRAGECRPGIERLSQLTGFGESTVRAHLTALDRAGLIRRTRHRLADGTLSGYRYQVNLPALGLQPPPDFSAGPPPESSTEPPPDFSGQKGLNPEGENRRAPGQPPPDFSAGDGNGEHQDPKAVRDGIRATLGLHRDVDHQEATDASP